VKAFLAGPNGDNPPIIGPAGIAHMSIFDFANWAGWNAGEGKRGPNLVRPETMRRLHTPVVSMPEQKDAPPGTPSRGRYALGWGELTVDWAPEPLLYHGGSNGMNLAHIWLDTKRDIAMVVVTNIGGPRAKEALFSIAPCYDGEPTISWTAERVAKATVIEKILKHLKVQTSISLLGILRKSC